MEEEDIDFTSIKIGLLGDGAVGKSSICNTFTGIEFADEMVTTVGSARFEKKITLSNEKEIKLVLWDTAGQERFRSAGFRTIRSVQGIALVFDVINRKSFDNIETWLNEIEDNLDKPCLVLLGNKIDIEEDKWNVTQEEIDKFVQEKKITYYPTSAKTNQGINEAFTDMANLIYKKFGGKKEDNIVITKKKQKDQKNQGKKCC